MKYMAVLWMMMTYSLTVTTQIATALKKDAAGGSGLLSQWEILSGVWTEKDGALIGSGGHLIYKESYTDYVLEITVEKLSGAAWAAMGVYPRTTLFLGGNKIFRNGTSDMQGYGFNFTSDGRFNLYNSVNGALYLINPTWKEYQKTDALTNSVNTFRIEAIKDRVVISANGKQLASFTDGTHAYGAPCLWVQEPSQFIKFSNFKFTPMNKDTAGKSAVRNTQATDITAASSAISGTGAEKPIIPQSANCKNSGDCITEALKASTYEEALAAAESAVKLLSATDDIDTRRMAYQIRGETYLYQFKKTNDKALISRIENDFHKASTIDPASILPFLGLASLYELQKQDLMVEEFFQKASEVDPRSSRVPYEHARYWLRQKKTETALKDLDKAVELLGGTFYKNGVYTITTGDPEATDKNKSDIFYTRADLLLDMQQNEKALADFSNVIKYDPYNSNAYWYRAKIKIAASAQYSNSQSIIEDLDKVIELSPDFGDAYYWKAQALLANQDKYPDYTVTVKCLVKAAELDAELSDGYAYAAQLLFNNDQFESAFKLANLAISKTTKQNALGVAYYVIGYIYANNRDRDNMMYNFRKAAEYGNADARELLKKLKP